MTRVGRRANISGERFGRIVATKPLHTKRKAWVWEFLCDCGNITTAKVTAVRSGKKISCGCFAIEVLKSRVTTHGKRKTPEYTAWCNARRRCYDKSVPSWISHGGRGITVCDRWRDSFENFYSDMGPRPSPKHSIDRINNDGNYDPSNCRWATAKEQAKNRRRRKLRVWGVVFVEQNRTWSAKIGDKKYKRFKTKAEADAAHAKYRESR